MSFNVNYRKITDFQKCQKVARFWLFIGYSEIAFIFCNEHFLALYCFIKLALVLILAFVPPEDVIGFFNKIKEDLDKSMEKCMIKTTDIFVKPRIKECLSRTRYGQYFIKYNYSTIQKLYLLCCKKKTCHLNFTKPSPDAFESASSALVKSSDAQINLTIKHGQNKLLTQTSIYGLKRTREIHFRVVSSRAKYDVNKNSVPIKKINLNGFRVKDALTGHVLNVYLKSLGHVHNVISDQ
ncbi:hypothetical protein BpHYR1_044149 [Brachionus plicatilis]|uniref:Uncharacterized protein n=1 Tax=Brachionus plicatilis TaxID=10195 RepID=A0A3M7Q2W8_BRAPC|nr:hypothetical protein BpHYR1_044149 [Brachionus plicatilis]